MNFITQAFIYVVTDSFFFPSMAFVTMVGIFIGAVIYDGNMRDLKKMLVSLICYGVLIAMVNLTRVIPQLPVTTPDKLHQPLASIETMLLVTIFYLLGTFVGVEVVKYAHRSYNKR
jgi:hypothetical protein